MKSILTSCLLLCFVSYSWAQTGYNIKVNIKPFKKEYIYLGYHYGKKKALADSTILDENSNGLFTGTKPLNGGIYFIVSPQKQILFELLIDKQQHFSIVADTSNLPGSIKFSGSPDNTLFQTYTLRLNEVGKEIASLQQQLAQTTNTSQQAKTKARIEKDNQSILLYRDSIEKKNPEVFLTALFRAMKEPVIPPGSQQPNGKYDT